MLRRDNAGPSDTAAPLGRALGRRQRDPEEVCFPWPSKHPVKAVIQVLSRAAAQSPEEPGHALSKRLRLQSQRWGPGLRPRSGRRFPLGFHSLGRGNEGTSG